RTTSPHRTSPKPCTCGCPTPWCRSSTEPDTCPTWNGPNSSTRSCSASWTVTAWETDPHRGRTVLTTTVQEGYAPPCGRVLSPDHATSPSPWRHHPGDDQITSDVAHGASHVQQSIDTGHQRHRPHGQTHRGGD